MPHLKYMPNVLETIQQEELTNMTEQEQRETMKQELFEQMESAREAKAQARRNLKQAQKREQELRAYVGPEYHALQELERTANTGSSDALQAARELPKRTRKLQEAYDELGILQNTTIPRLEEAHERATIELELREALTGKQGYLTRDEANEIITQATQEIQGIIQGALIQLRASDEQVHQMTATVERGQRQGIIDPLPHDAPIKVTGTSMNHNLFINGQAIPKDHENQLKEAVSKVYDQAADTLNR